jgi:hypothetical protein
VERMRRKSCDELKRYEKHETSISTPKTNTTRPNILITRSSAKNPRKAAHLPAFGSGLAAALGAALGAVASSESVFLMVFLATAETNQDGSRVVNQTNQLTINR